MNDYLTELSYIIPQYFKEHSKYNGVKMKLNLWQNRKLILAKIKANILKDNKFYLLLLILILCIYNNIVVTVNNKQLKEEIIILSSDVSSLKYEISSLDSSVDDIQTANEKMNEGIKQLCERFNIFYF